MIQRFTTTLRKKAQLTTDVFLFTFDLKNPAELDFEAGQYLILFCPGDEPRTPNNEHIRRLYSIASSPLEKNSVEILTKIIPGGIASEYFRKMTEGEEVIFEGPAGRFIMNGTQKHKVFLATGTGLAPIRSMLRSELGVQSSEKITEPRTPNPELIMYELRWGLPKYEDVYFFDELKELAQTHANFSFTICLSREENLEMIPEADRKYFQLGRITKDFTPEFMHTDYYICGNRDVVDNLKQHLNDKQIDNTAVVFEKF